MRGNDAPACAPTQGNCRKDVSQRSEKADSLMKISSTLAILLTSLAVVLFAGGAQGQTSAPAAAAKQKIKTKEKTDSGATIAVTVTNKRKAAVVELDAALAGSAAFKPLLRKLAPGKQSVVTLPRDESCTFDFYIKYDDGETNTVTGVDVCPDGKLNLVE
jgi:hypothetical protein